MNGEKITRPTVSGLLEQEADASMTATPEFIEENDSDDTSTPGDVMPNPA
jgi:hypothetical protein